MRLIAALTTVSTVLAGAVSARSQDEHMAMHHGGTVLLVAQASATKLVPAGASGATATGAFQINRQKGSFRYEVTYQDLQGGPPKRVALHNFGAGGNGEAIYVLCGEGARPCPDKASGNLAGEAWDEGSRVKLDNELLGEFASARVYLEVTGGDGKPEIRGQLEPNGAMSPVRSFVAHLTPARAGASGVGTAVLSEVYLPEGRVAVFYEVTVAGTSGPPQAAALVGAPANADAGARAAARRNTLPKTALRSRPAAAAGGTMTGQYEVRRDQQDAVSASRLSATAAEVGISVSTSRFADGELYGAFQPVK